MRPHFAHPPHIMVRYALEIHIDFCRATSHRLVFFRARTQTRKTMRSNSTATVRQLLYIACTWATFRSTVCLLFGKVGLNVYCQSGLCCLGLSAHVGSPEIAASSQPSHPRRYHNIAWRACSQSVCFFVGTINWLATRKASRQVLCPMVVHGMSTAIWWRRHHQQQHQRILVFRVCDSHAYCCAILCVFAGFSFI